MSTCTCNRLLGLRLRVLPPVGPLTVTRTCAELSVCRVELFFSEPSCKKKKSSTLKLSAVFFHSHLFFPGSLLFHPAASSLLNPAAPNFHPRVEPAPTAALAAAPAPAARQDGEPNHPNSIHSLPHPVLDSRRRGKLCAMWPSSDAFPGES